jgi:hypothetical protein
VATRKRFNTGCLFPLLECHQKLISLIRSSCSSQARATPEPLRYFYPAESALRLHLPPLPRLSARHCRQGRLVCSASAERKVCWTASFDRTRLSGLNGIYTASLLLGLVKLSICAEPTASTQHRCYLASEYWSQELHGFRTFIERAIQIIQNYRHKYMADDHPQQSHDHIHSHDLAVISSVDRKPSANHILHQRSCNIGSSTVLMTKS